VSSLRLGNGKFENTTFNSRLQPIQIGLGSSATSQNLLKLNFDYGLADNNGNVKSQTITTPTTGNITGFIATQSYTYDSLNRLKSAEETIPNQLGWKQTFKYDRYGNREFDTANNNTNTLANGCPVAVCNPSANPQDNKLVGTTYDDAGNTKIDASNQSYVYDAENKMVKAKNGSGATLGDYFYDGDGKRVKKFVPSTSETTIFVYDAGGKMVAEYSTVTASQSEAKVSYLTNDHLGSPRITTDTTGKVVSRRDFMPFGEEIQRANYGNDSIREKFATYERDGETGLDFAQMRMYDKNRGRFTAVDPYSIIFEKENGYNNKAKMMIYIRFAVQPQNWNRYIYVLNNPLNKIDPFGLIFVKTSDGVVHYIEDKTYNSLGKTEIEKQIGKFNILPTGTVINVKEGATGIFAPYVGQKVVLGDAANLYPISESDLDLGTVIAEYDPITPPMVDNTRSNEYPGQVFGMLNRGVDAWKYQDQRFPNGDPAGRKDPYLGGYRHCTSNCLLYRRLGDDVGNWGRLLWDIKKEWFSGVSDSITDMQAEDIGQFLSDQRGRCEVLCSNTYTSPPR
jgi:RHS repeat-associated protein